MTIDPCSAVTTTTATTGIVQGLDNRHDGEEDDTSQNSRDEALREMLGLTSLDDVACEETLETCRPSSTTPIRLPRNVSRHFNPSSDCFAIIASNIVTEDECRELIKLGANAPAADGKRGFEYITEAKHTSPDGSQHSVKLQNPNPHKLSVFEHSPSVKLLWQRLQPVIMQSQDFQNFIKRKQCGEPTGLNPRLRVLRYDGTDDDEFRPHYDATTRIGSETSLITVLLYLNDGSGHDFEGGETLYLDASIQQDPIGYNQQSQRNDCTPEERANLMPTNMVAVAPSVGTCVLFEHDLYHSGAPLAWGTKYVLRTDVLFQIAEIETSAESDQSIPNAHRLGSVDTQPTTFSTVKDLCNKLIEEDHGMTTQDRDSLLEIGLLDSSVEAFCSPGRFVLHQMLQESFRSSHAITVLLDAAFLYVQKRSN